MINLINVKPMIIRCKVYSDGDSDSKPKKRCRIGALFWVAYGAYANLILASIPCRLHELHHFFDRHL